MTRNMIIVNVNLYMILLYKKIIYRKGGGVEPRTILFWMPEKGAKMSPKIRNYR
jgi:hypothetical protein